MVCICFDFKMADWFNNNRGKKEIRLATGYNILQPNGVVKKVKASNMDERFKVVCDLIDEWSGYCEKNWVGVNNANPYSPENKVKAFLSSLGYFLIMGNADDIVTDYKQVMNGKREIPVSSCPSFVEDKMYSGIHVNTNETLKKAESECFSGIMESMDAKANKRYGIRSTKKKVLVKTRYDKIKEIEASGVKLCCEIVDTNNEFTFVGTRFRISSSMCPQYGPKKTKSGVLYDMDSIFIAVDKNDFVVGLYDGDINRIPDGSVTSV